MFVLPGNTNVRNLPSHCCDVVVCWRVNTWFVLGQTWKIWLHCLGLLLKISLDILKSPKIFGPCVILLSLTCHASIILLFEDICMCYICAFMQTWFAWVKILKGIHIIASFSTMLTWNPCETYIVYEFYLFLATIHISEQRGAVSRTRKHMASPYIYMMLC